MVDIVKDDMDVMPHVENGDKDKNYRWLLDRKVNDALQNGYIVELDSDDHMHEFCNNKDRFILVSRKKSGGPVVSDPEALSFVVYKDKDNDEIVKTPIRDFVTTAENRIINKKRSAVQFFKKLINKVSGRRIFSGDTIWNRWHRHMAGDKQQVCDCEAVDIINDIYKKINSGVTSAYNLLNCEFTHVDCLMHYGNNVVDSNVNKNMPDLRLGRAYYTIGLCGVLTGDIDIEAFICDCIIEFNAQYGEIPRFYWRKRPVVIHDPIYGRYVYAIFAIGVK